MPPQPPNQTAALFPAAALPHQPAPSRGGLADLRSAFGTRPPAAAPPPRRAKPSDDLDADEAPAQPLPGRLPSYIRDHRKRLRERFLQGGATALPDYELLELLLFRALPRQDVKPLAHRLLATFGDFNAVVSAPAARLAEVPGAGPAVLVELRLVAAAAQRLARAKLLQRPVLSSWDALLDYCHTSLAHRQTEEARVLYLDSRNALIADESQGQGTVDHVPIYPREVMKRALELCATALILVHNHPSGDPTPSQADIAMTEQIRQIGAAMGITLHDHLVIGRDREISFRAEGYL